MQTSIKRILWFLKRPRFYPEAVRRFYRKISISALSSNHTAESRGKALIEATQWCEKYAVDTKTALSEISNLTQFQSFEEKFKPYIKIGREISSKCPFNMGGGGNLSLIFELSEYLKAEKVIETGVSYGWSSLAFLLSLSQRSNSVLVSTDLPYLFEESEIYVGCVVPEELKTLWKVIPEADREALPKALELIPQADIVHYDSDKFYEGRLWAYPQLWNVLRVGGIFLSDDVNDDFAFRDFCHSIKQKPVIVKTPMPSGNKYVGILIKSNNANSLLN